MHTILLALGRWLLACAGVQFELAAVPTHLKLTRDSRGRFRPKDAPPPGELSPEEQLLEDAGITPKLQQAATVDFSPPDDVHDVEAFQRRLREYIAANLNAWVNPRPRNLWLVFAALKDTYAIDQKQWQTQLAAVKAARKPPVRSEVKGKMWIGYPIGHGARAFCPPAAAHEPAPCAQDDGSTPTNETTLGIPLPPPTSDTPTLRLSDSPLGESLVEPSKPAECPRSVHEGNSEPESSRRAECPRSVADTPITVPKYDPDYDVVAGLPKQMRGVRCNAGYLRGLGNDAQEATENYYQRNQLDFHREGMDWEMFGMPCTVFTAEDTAGRRYCIALADPAKHIEQMKAKLGSAPVVDDATGARPGWLRQPTAPDQATAAQAAQSLEQHTGARAFCPPAGDNGTAPCKQHAAAILGTVPELEIAGLAPGIDLNHKPIADQSDAVSYHRVTETPSKDPDLSVPLCLGGEKQEVIKGETEVEADERAECPRSVHAGNSLPDRSISGQAVRSPNSRPPPHYLHLLDPP